MHACSTFSFFFPKLIIIFIITITARTTQRLSKRSAKQQKVIQPRAVPVLSKRSAKRQKVIQPRAVPVLSKRSAIKVNTHTVFQK